MLQKPHNVSKTEIGVLDNKNYNHYAKNYIYNVCRSGTRITILLGQLSKQLPADVTGDLEVLKAMGSFYGDRSSPSPQRNVHMLIARLTLLQQPEERSVFAIIILFDSLYRFPGPNSDSKFQVPYRASYFFQKAFQEAGARYGIESLMGEFTEKELKPVKSSRPVMSIASIRTQFSEINKILPVCEKNSKCEYLVTSHTLEPEIDLPIDTETGFLKFPDEITGESKKNKLIDIINGK